jgi:hypothetical protein
VRIGEAPSDAVPGRLLPLYELTPSLYPSCGVIVTSGLICEADPSALRGHRSRSGRWVSQRIPSRIGEAHLPPAPCSSCASWSDTRFNVTVKSRPSARFPDQAKKFPDGPN